MNIHEMLEPFYIRLLIETGKDIIADNLLKSKARGFRVARKKNYKPSQSIYKIIDDVRMVQRFYDEGLWYR